MDRELKNQLIPSIKQATHTLVSSSDVKITSPRTGPQLESSLPSPTHLPTLGVGHQRQCGSIHPRGQRTADNCQIHRHEPGPLPGSGQQQLAIKAPLRAVEGYGVGEWESSLLQWVCVGGLLIDAGSGSRMGYCRCPRFK